MGGGSSSVRASLTFPPHSIQPSVVVLFQMCMICAFVHVFIWVPANIYILYIEVVLFFKYACVSIYICVLIYDTNKIIFLISIFIKAFVEFVQSELLMSFDTD